MIGTGIDIPGAHIKADALNVIAGVLTGTVADIQNFQDGNTINIDEVAATPGMDMEILFVGVRSFRRIGLQMYYSGSNTHWIEVQMWNYTEAAWKTVWTFSNGLGLNYRYSDLPETQDAFVDYVDGSGNAKMRICHPSNGNAAHDSIIGYAALII